MKKQNGKNKGRILQIWMMVILVLGIFLSPSTLLISHGQNEEIKDITVHVILNQDGSAFVTQKWDVKAEKGTEYYIVMSNMGDMEIQNFTVQDETGRVFQNEGEWNIDRNMEQKAYKNGIVYKSNGLELCWGIGSYGDRVYTLSYTLTNLVKAYPDMDGFNSRFINDQLSAPVNSAKVIIEKENYALTPSEVNMWGFGYTGTVDLQEGKVVAQPEGTLYQNNNVTIMLGFPKGIFTPVSQGSGTFEDLKLAALVGSDYTADNDSSGQFQESEELFRWGSFLDSSWMGLAILTPFLLFFVSLYNYARRINKAKIVLPKDLDYSRDLPGNGSIPLAIHSLVLTTGVEEENILSAYILRWIKQGEITVEKATRQRMLRFGKIEESSLVLGNGQSIVDPVEKMLYKIFVEASGPDRILQENEFKKWARKNHEELRLWFGKVKLEGEKLFETDENVEIIEEKKFFNLINKKKTTVTPKGLSVIYQIAGFKKFLEDFTLVSERGAMEVQLWDDYLVFAGLYGIAERVAQEMANIYPDFKNTSVYYNSGQGDMLTTLLMVNALSNSGYQGVVQAESRSDGGGGSSSFGGGGGFSGGGSGGGSR